MKEKKDFATVLQAIKNTQNAKASLLDKHLMYSWLWTFLGAFESPD